MVVPHSYFLLLFHLCITHKDLCHYTKCYCYPIPTFLLEKHFTMRRRPIATQIIYLSDIFMLTMYMYKGKA